IPGARAGSNGLVGRDASWLRYQSRLARERLTSVTSCRTPSTSCRYHTGNVSLSPYANSTPYGSTDCTRLNAKSRATVASGPWRRDAAVKFAANGASARNEATAIPIRREATFDNHCTSTTSPNAAKTPHTLKLTTKK